MQHDREVPWNAGRPSRYISRGSRDDPSNPPYALGSSMLPPFDDDDGAKLFLCPDCGQRTRTIAFPRNAKTSYYPKCWSLEL